MKPFSKQEVRDDIYWTLEGVTGFPKSYIRGFLSQYFDTAYLVFGDTKELYEYLYKLCTKE